MRRIVSWMMFALLLAGTLTLAFNVGLVRAQAPETVTINSDGSVSPSSAPISTFDNVTYTFTSNVTYPTYNGIVVERSNIVINGNGYTVHGYIPPVYILGGIGLNVTRVSNATIEDANVEGFQFGIYLESSSNNNTVIGNTATGNMYGIYLDSSSNNIVSGNNATANFSGISLNSFSNNNTVSGNSATANGVGIYLFLSSYNTVSGNTATASYIDGIDLDTSFNNTVSGNNASANRDDGIDLGSSSNNTVSGNNATANSDCGIDILAGYPTHSSNNIVSGNNVTANLDGILLNSSSNNNTVSGNNATANSQFGIWLESSSNDIVSGNSATANGVGIELDTSSNNNTVSGNNVTANSDGIVLGDSSNNALYHNNFINNTSQVNIYNSTNTWDNGYPSGGNYWSDYNGTDLYSGPYQNVTGSDGIGDTPYGIDADNTDHYPLMGAFSDFSVALGVDVQVVSNSTVSDFQFNGTAILFNVSGVNGSTGFCNVCVPTSLLNGTITVFVNGTQVQYSLLPSSNSSISYLYFTYGHSTEQVIILPEFPEPLILAMFMLATLLAIAIYKKRHNHS